MILLELYIRRRLGVQCVEQCPAIAVEVSITQFFTFLMIFLKLCALVKEKEHGVPCLGKAPLPFHARLVLAHIYLNLDASPRTVWCNNNNMKGTRYQLKENCKMQCKMGDNTCFARVLSFFYLLNLEDKEVLLLSLLPETLHPPFSKFVFFQFFCHDILLSLAAHGANKLNFQNKMASHWLKIQNGCHVILARLRSYHFPIG